MDQTLRSGAGPAQERPGSAERPKGQSGRAGSSAIISDESASDKRDMGSDDY